MLGSQTLSPRWLTYQTVSAPCDDIVHADLHAIVTRLTISLAQVILWETLSFRASLEETERPRTKTLRSQLLPWLEQLGIGMEMRGHLPRRLLHCHLWIKGLRSKPSLSRRSLFCAVQRAAGTGPAVHAAFQAPPPGHPRPRWLATTRRSGCASHRGCAPASA